MAEIFALIGMAFFGGLMGMGVLIYAAYRIFRKVWD